MDISPSMNTENSTGKWLLLEILFLKTSFLISVRKYKDMEFFMDLWVKISHQSQQIDKKILLFIVNDEFIVF